jgi:hypothetical protein
MWVLGLSSNGNSNIAYSADGITWKYASYSLNTILTQINAIASNGSMWIAVGFRPSDGTAHAIYSYDGYNWYESTSAASIFGGSSSLLAVAWNGTMWVIGGYGPGASLAYSYDGINWKKVTSVVPYVHGIAYNSSMWIVVGNNNTYEGGDCIGYSYDGISWTLSTSGSNLIRGANDVEWNGIMWVAVSSRVAGSPYPAGVGAAYSYDGINWTAASGVIATGVGQVLNITWNGSRWFASCIISSQTIGSYYQTMITSVDGINWTLDSSASSLVSNSIYGVSSRRFITYDPPSRRQLGGTGTTSAGGTSNVNFGSTLFSTTPIITATVTGVNPAAVLLSSMGPTGFTATTYNPSFSITGPVPFNWNAIQL